MYGFNKYNFEFNLSEKTSFKATVNGNYHAVNIFDRITEEGVFGRAYRLRAKRFGASQIQRLAVWLCIGAGRPYGWRLYTGDAFRRTGIQAFGQGGGLSLSSTLRATITSRRSTTSTGCLEEIRTCVPEEGYTTDMSVEYSRTMGRFFASAGYGIPFVDRRLDNMASERIPLLDG